MNSLLWKARREARVYLSIFIAWMTIAACYAIAYELGHHYRAAVGHFSGLALFYSAFAAIVLAMRTSRGEETDGTISFSASLPVSLRRVGAVRIVSAAATLAIPIVIAAVILSLSLALGLVEQAEPRHMDNHMPLLQRGTASLPTSMEQLWSVTAIAIMDGLELLLLLSLLGCYLRTQAQVGLMGAVLALGAMIAAGVLWVGHRNPYAQLVYGVLLPQSLAIQWGYGYEHGSYIDHELAAYRWVAMGLALPLLGIIGRLFAARYGRTRRSLTPADRRRFRLAFSPILSRIPIRFSGRTMAMIWLELRQSVPLAVFGLLLTVLISVASVLTERQGNHSFGTSVLMEMPHSMFFMAMLWAVVVGSSVYSADLGSGLGIFWRSRPISPGMWFWTKFVIGLVAVLAVLDGVTILVAWNSPREEMTAGMSWAYVGCFPIIHALMYALAVLGTCWLRKPAIGGVLAILAFAVLTAVITAFPTTNRLEPIKIYNALLSSERGVQSAERAGHVDFTKHGYPLVYGALAVSIVLLALLSSRLARPLQPALLQTQSISRMRR
jgi:hypothetical protein